MIKIIGFTRRNPGLSHDEYRAGHIGHHSSHGRRLRNIRGYVINVRANAGPEPIFAQLLPGMVKNEPPGFDALWDGYGQLNFDSLDDYFRATEGEPDQATAAGLVVNPSVRTVGGDGAFLYGGSPYQFSVDELAVVTVRRPEAKMVKLVQFVKRNPELSPSEFRARWFGAYAPIRARFPGLRGAIFNLRDDATDVLSGFLPPHADAFTATGTAAREAFYANWDGFAEFWYEDIEIFLQGHGQVPVTAALIEAERGLFAATWYREVDESVNVMPNRKPAPPFYYR